MPDASSENITSLLSWFILSLATGYWVGDIIKDLVLACVYYKNSHLYQALTLFPVVCALINVLLSNLISPKWLIIEPKSPQSLKNIYRVLKFAAKHKAPLNRSALTYWEEDIPSRLDLGKSRYGGPFTTEQVEDVKIFFRILAVSVGIFLTVFASVIHEYDYYSTEVYSTTTVSICEANVLFLFTLHPGCGATLIVLVYEFLIYPCFNYRLPSSMKRIGIVSFAVVLQNITYLNCKHPNEFPYCGERSTMDNGYQLSTVWCALSGYVYTISRVCLCSGSLQHEGTNDWIHAVCILAGLCLGNCICYQILPVLSNIQLFSCLYISWYCTQHFCFSSLSSNRSLVQEESER